MPILKRTISSSETIANIFWNYRTELAYRLYFNRFQEQRLNIPNNIVNCVVNSACQEFDFCINSESLLLNRLISNLKNNLKIAESHLVIGGIVVLKPYINAGKIGVVVYGARDAVPFYNEFGELQKVYFKTDIRKSDTDSYTLVEIHTYDENSREYRIDNQLYTGINSDWNRKLGTMAPQLGTRVPLNSCENTAYLDDYYVLEDINRHLCSVISLDNGMTYNKGRSLYDSSIHLIENAEKQYDSLLWEYKGGELAIDANADLFKVMGKSRGGYVLPEGKERLYRRLEGANPEFDIKVFAPALRDESYIRGLNQIYRQIENNCNLYHGALSDVDQVQKSATEVIASKQRFYAMIMMIKNKFKVGIQEIIENCLTIYNNMMPYFLNEDIDINFDIGDSVIDLINPAVNSSV